MAEFGKKVRKSVVEFLGVGEEDEKNANRWDQRRKRYAGSIGQLKDEYMEKESDVDIVDGGQRAVRDPLHRPSVSSRVLARRPTRKDSVAVMAVKGIGRFLASKRGSKVPVRGSGEEEGQDAFSLVDDVFYDDDQTKARLEQQAAPAPGWRRQPPQALPSTPGTDVVDAPDFGMSRIKQKVLDSITYRDKRTVGIGAIGQLFRPSIAPGAITKDVRMQLDEMEDHRPYFTYWATFVHIVVFIVAMSVYGAAPFGIGDETETKIVRMSNLARETQSQVVQRNFWYGPRKADLIHLGAKYSPCMRVDTNLEISMELDRKEESSSACCVRNDGSGCVQRIKSQCGSLSSWKRWSAANLGPGNRTSGTVCGQDPMYCLKPASSPPYEWPDDITKWPLCTETEELPEHAPASKDRHMNCEVLGHPCCHGIQGECIITTEEHCELKRGFFHKEAFLCSQVSCFKQICGMIPFADAAKPDQFYRLWTSLFLHSGLITLAVTVVFQMWFMRDLEKLIGAIRMAIIFLGSGIASNLASSTFVPYDVGAGPSGSHFGIMACLLVEMLQSYQMYRRPMVAIMKLVAPIVFLFVLGLLPWLDNWSHLFGFLFGFLLAFGLMPYVSFGPFDRQRKLISIIVSLGCAIGMFIMLVLIFYVAPLTDCEACHYFNCIPFTDSFCEGMHVTLKKNSTYSKI